MSKQQPETTTVGIHQRRGVYWKIARLTLGIVLTVSGLAMLVLPGPGLLTLVASVFVLSVDIPVLRRLRKWMARRFPSIFQNVEDWFEGRPALGPDGTPLPPPGPIERIRRALHWVLPIVGVVVSVAVVFWMDSWLDEALYLHYGRQLWLGESIYRSGAGANYMPPMYLYFGLPQALYGPSFIMGRVEAVATTFFGWMLIWYALKWLRFKWAGLVAGAMFLTNMSVFGWFVTASPYCLVFSLTACALAFLARGGTRPLYTFGFVVCVALVCWTRRNMVPPMAVVCAVYVLLHPRWRRLLVVIGVLTVLSVAIAWVVLGSQFTTMVGSALMPPQASTSPMAVGQTSWPEIRHNLRDYAERFWPIWLAMLVATGYGLTELRRRGLGLLRTDRGRFTALVGVLGWATAVSHLLGPLGWDPGPIDVYFNYASPMLCVAVGIGLEHFGGRLWARGRQYMPETREREWPPSCRVLAACVGILLVANLVAPNPGKWNWDPTRTLPRMDRFAAKLKAYVSPNDRVFWLVWSRPNPLYLAELKTWPALMNDSFTYALPDKKRSAGKSWDRFIGRAWLTDWATVCVVSEEALKKYGEKAPEFRRYLKEVLREHYVLTWTIEDGWPDRYGRYYVYCHKDYPHPPPASPEMQP